MTRYPLCTRLAGPQSQSEDCGTFRPCRDSIDVPSSP